MKKITGSLLSLLTFFATANSALAQVLAKPTQLGLTPAATPQMERITWFHDGLLMAVVVGTVIFVTALMFWVVIRYNEKANKTASKTTHHVTLEVIWTIVPILILLVIAVPSFKMLYYLDRTENPEMTLKVTGYQWYWGYEYQGNDEVEGITFDSYLIPEEEIDEAKGQKRLLSTDNVVVLPIDTNIQILITSADVIHSFTVPAFGFKKDAVPGRMNETWVNIKKPGRYYGQCSQICGINHAYMPVEVLAVTKEEFAQWVAQQKAKTANNNTNNANDTTKLAVLEGVN